jgi:hypothetical protein
MPFRNMRMPSRALQHCTDSVALCIELMPYPNMLIPSRLCFKTAQAKIGEGYPKESPSTDESPLKVVAQLRNAGVPYSVDFNLGKYAKRTKTYKSKDTMAAEGRQRDEDREVERLMQ